MEQVIKTYLGIFLMMLLSTVGIGIVAAEAQICQARNFKSDVVVELAFKSKSIVLRLR